MIEQGVVNGRESREGLSAADICELAAAHCGFLADAFAEAIRGHLVRRPISNDDVSRYWAETRKHAPALCTAIINRGVGTDAAQDLDLPGRVVALGTIIALTIEEHGVEKIQQLLMQCLLSRSALALIAANDRSH